MIMANITEKNNSNITHQEEDTVSLSDLPIAKTDEYSGADRNKTRSSINDMFSFSSPENQQRIVTKPTRFSTKYPEDIRYLAKQASPMHHPMLSKSSSKTSPGKRSVKKSEDWIFQKSKSTSLYPSRSKKGGIEHEYEDHKVSIFSSPLKSKWLFVLLGLPPKIPTDAAELKTDIKNRQSRHAPSTFFPINAGCEEVVPLDSPRPKASQKRKKSMLGSCFGTAGPVQI